MAYQYEIERKDLSQIAVEKLLKWLSKHNIKFLKTDQKIVVQHDDYFFIYRFDKVISAIRVGFKFEDAIKIITEDWEYLMIDVKRAAEKKANHLLRMLSRVIGEKGKAKNKLGELTKAKIIIDDRFVHILGDKISSQAAYESIRKLIRGSPHSSVFNFAVSYRRHLKNKEREAKYYLNL